MLKLTFALAAAMAATALPAFAQSGATTTRAMPTCSVGDAVVWENTKTKAYHLQGDAYFGTTKHGRYACRSAAEGAGYHAAGSRAAGTTGTSGTTMTSPGSSKRARPVAPLPAETAAAPDSETATPARSKHHRRHHGMASPGPMTASPLPASTQ